MAADGGPLATRREKDLLRFLTCGSVDDGKSTLIGRLLYDCSLVLDDQLATLERESRRFGTAGDDIDFSLLLDGLEDERQQRITIDVAYRFFATPERAFAVADTPGHEQYTRNMATGASTCELAVILVDARKGVLPQTKRHAFISSLLGIRHIVLAVNKMDLVGFDERCFEEIATQFSAFAAGLGNPSVRVIPLAARSGDNVTTRSARMPWYQGTDLARASSFGRGGWRRRATVPLSGAMGQPPEWRVPRLLRDRRIGLDRAGRRGAGRRLGARPRGSRRSSRFDGPLDCAAEGDAVTLTLDSEIDIARGDLLADPRDPPECVDQFAAHVIWLSEQPLVPGRSYLLKIGTRTVPATVTALKHRIDIETLAHLADKTLGLNEIGFCNLSTAAPVAFDPYAVNRDTGAFILIDRFTNETAGAGMIAFGLRRASNIHWQALTVGREQRAALKEQAAAVLWLTGLSGAGKSTIADLVEKKLLAAGPAHDAARRRQCAARAQPRPRLHRRRPGREHPPRRRSRQADDRGRADRDLLVHLAVSRRAPDGAGAGGPDRLSRDLCRHPARRVHPARSQGPLRQGQGRAGSRTSPVSTSAYEPPEAPEVRVATIGATPEAAAEHILDELRRREII